MPNLDELAKSKLVNSTLMNVDDRKSEPVILNEPNPDQNIRNVSSHHYTWGWADGSSSTA